MHRTVQTVFLVVLLMVLTAAPAQAEQPVKFTEEVQGYVQPISGCEFEVIQTVDLTHTNWTHFDQDGNVVQVRDHVAVRTATFTNPANGRSTSTSGGAYTQTWNASDPFVITHTGQVAHGTIPGEGVVVLDAGRVVFTPFEFVFVAGHHDIFFGPIIGAPLPEAFCAYLAG